jgi:hypothetical protein
VNATTGDALPSWLPAPNDTVDAIALSQHGVALGGIFTAVGRPRTSEGTEPDAAASGGFALFNGLPEAPTGVSVSPRDGGATITFTPSTFSGGLPVTYVVTGSPGGSASGTSSPIQVNGLTNGVAYTFTVVARNAVGDSVPVVTGSVTPNPAPVVPSAPTIVGVTAGIGEATVQFTPGSDGGSPVTSYVVTSNPGNHQASGLATSLTVTGLTNGQSYTFTVTATNGVGTSAPSAPSSPVIPGAVPGAPTISAVTPGDSLVSVHFSPPADDGGAPITSYVVTSSPGNHTGSGATSPVVVTGLKNGEDYTFTIKAINAVGTGPASAPSSVVTPRTVPGAPTGAAATPGNGQATVSFVPPASNGGADITGYVVTSFPGNTSASGASSPITVTGLTNGVSYTFTVKAVNEAGSGPASAESNEVTPGAPVVVPGAPTGATANPGNGQASVSFTPPVSDGGSAITSYTVTSSPGGHQASGAGSPIVVTGLTNDTSYTFTVTATNVAGTGPASAPSNAVTPTASLTAPGAPTNVVATPGNGQAVVTFDAPASTGGTPILSYTVTASPGGLTATGSSSPIILTGLTNNTSYTFTVEATNAAGTGPDSSPSAPVVPEAGVRTEPPDPPAEQPRPEIPAIPPPSGPRKPPPNH